MRVGDDQVVPLVGQQLRAVDRRGGLIPSVGQGVELLDLLSARLGQEPVGDGQRPDLNEGVAQAFPAVSSFGDRESVEQFADRQNADAPAPFQILSAPVQYVTTATDVCTHCG